MATDGVVKVERALLSVFDKTGLADFAKELARLGVDLVSTGGTHKLIAGTGAAVREISDLTGFPEMMDGRVKTLHPKVHGGLLARRDDEGHVGSMREHKIQPIDMVVVNLYPFEQTVASGADYDTIIENIDIGGPAMVRSAGAVSPGRMTRGIDGPRSTHSTVWHPSARRDTHATSMATWWRTVASRRWTMSCW